MHTRIPKHFLKQSIGPLMSVYGVVDSTPELVYADRTVDLRQSSLSEDP